MTPEERREQIVSAADRVFEGRDPAAVTFEEIAAEAGVSRALVYTYFGDKGGLLAAVYSHALSTLDKHLQAALSAAVAPRARIRAVVEHYLAFAASHAGVWHFLGQAAATQHPAVQSARRARLEALAEAWGGGPEARLAVAGLVGLIEAAVLDWLESPELDAARVADLLEEMAWCGLDELVSTRFGRVPEPLG